MPGDGTVVASVLAAELPEPGHLNGQMATALVDVVPLNQNGGQQQELHRVRGDHAAISTILSMATVTVFRHNPLSMPSTTSCTDMANLEEWRSQPPCASCSPS